VDGRLSLPAEAIRFTIFCHAPMTIMPLGKKIALVVIVLQASLATAWALRKETAAGDLSAAAPPTGEFIEPVTRRLTADSSARPPRAPMPFRLAPQSEAVLGAPVAATGSGGGESVALPLNYQRTLSPVGALLRPLEGDSTAESSREGEPVLELSPPAGPAAAVGDTTAPRHHKIVDGDTLSRLAAEYLGSSERYLEIYELNRDLLASPDLLPIGKTLMLPPAESSGPPASQSDGPSAPLVPIAPGTLQRAGN
jgi:nucleoid-associated protein YgaU